MTSYCVGAERILDSSGVFGVPTGMILKTTDGGENWSTVFSQKGLWVASVVGFDNEVYAFADNGSSLLVYSSDYGINWIIDTLNYNPTKKVKLYNKEIYFTDRRDNWNLKKLSNGHIQLVAKNVRSFTINQHAICGQGVAY